MADSINKYAKRRLLELDEEEAGKQRQPGQKSLREVLEAEDREGLDEDEKRRRAIARENRARIARGEKPLPIK